MTDADRRSADDQRLLLDVMVGKLAAYLRMCGHDAAYALDRGLEADDRLLELARRENRRLLTRDRELAARAENAVLLTDTAVEGQLRELHAAGIDLRLDDRPARCGACNGPVGEPAATTDRPASVPDEPRVWRCQSCGQWFWKGSHWDRVGATLASVREE